MSNSTIVTLEISMYPLTKDYEQYIIPFIKNLRVHDEVLVKTNAMSTYVQGEFSEVWSIIGRELQKAFDAKVPMSNVIKIIPSKLPVDNSWLEF